MRDRWNVPNRFRILHIAPTSPSTLENVETVP
jgi:hypothetical protein